MATFARRGSDANRPELALVQFTVASESGYDLEFGATNPWSDGFPWTAFMDTVRDAAHPNQNAEVLLPGE